jgi:predicted aspartyl protease
MAKQVAFRLAGGANPLILVPVKVEGKGPFDFILDSGASISLLSSELGRRLDVAVTGKEEGMGAAGSLTIELGRVRSVAIGDTEVHDVEVGLTDELSRIGEVVGAKIDGDIGYNILKGFSLTIDYERCLLGLSEPAEKPGRDGAIPFEIAPSKPLILLPVEVNGRGPYRFCLDTGTSMTAISPALAQVLGVPLTPGGRPGMAAGGRIAVSFGRLQRLAVGPHVSSDISVTSADFFSPIAAACGAAIDGIVGYNFLKSFEVTIDYPSRSLRLEQPG